MEDCLPAEEKRCCVELFSLYLNGYIWLVGGPLPLVFPALILYVLSVAFNWAVNSGDNNEHHFDLYGEVNSVKNTTINIWLNDGVY